MTTPPSAPIVMERKIETAGAPAGMCWSYRELHSYSAGVVELTDRLLAMAEGLDRAYVSWDQDDFYDDLNVYVIGLRPITDDDRAKEPKCQRCGGAPLTSRSGVGLRLCNPCGDEFAVWLENE